MTSRHATQGWQILAAAAATSACLLVGLCTAPWYHRRHTKETTPSIREKLPRDLKSWRNPPGFEDSLEPGDAIWRELTSFFAEKGFTLWKTHFASATVGPSASLSASGFMYITTLRGFTTQSGGISELLNYSWKNPLSRAARDAFGRDVVIRVLAVGSDGRKELEILDAVATDAYSVLSMNHTLPLIGLIDLDDITFGIFPKAGSSLTYAYHDWANTSVGDVLDIIIQCLEALVFLHHLNIAHRDVWKDNFLIQWMPETLSMKHLPASRPRVYLIDFEVAVYFADDVPEEERVCQGPPMGGSFPDSYGRPIPPEVASGKPYNPFKLDIWQLGTDFSDFRSTIPEIDIILVSMTDPDPVTRPSAYDAMKGLIEAIGAIPPSVLNISPPPKQPPATVSSNTSDTMFTAQ